MYKIFVNSPKDRSLINSIIDAAFSNGAESTGNNYDRCAFIASGVETWKTLNAKTAYKGAVGEITIEPSAQISFKCPEEKITSVIEAIKKVHPYESPVIDVIKLYV